MNIWLVLKAAEGKASGKSGGDGDMHGERWLAAHLEDENTAERENSEGWKLHTDRGAMEGRRCARQHFD